MLGRTIFLIVAVGLSAECYAMLLRCKVSNSDWRALFVIEPSNKGFIELKKSGTNETYDCGLEVGYFHDNRMGVSPSVSVGVQKGNCNPALGPLGDNIWNQISVNISLLRSSDPQVRIQWLRNRHPDACIVQKIVFESPVVTLEHMDPSFADFYSQLRSAAKQQQAQSIYDVLASDFYIDRDFGGSFNPKALPQENFRTVFQLDNRELSPEFYGEGWRNLTHALRVGSFQIDKSGKLCMIEKTPNGQVVVPARICFRQQKDGWRIAGVILAGD